MSWRRKLFWTFLFLCVLAFGTFRLHEGGYLESFPRGQNCVLQCRLFFGDQKAALDEAYRLALEVRSVLKDRGIKAARECYEKLAELNRRFSMDIALTDKQMDVALDLLIAQGKSGDIDGAQETYRTALEIAEPLSGQYRIERRKLQGAYLMLYYLQEPNRLDDALAYIEQADVLRRDFKMDIHTFRIGVAGLREATLGFLEHTRFDEGERIYRRLQDLRTAYPDDPKSAQEHLIAAVWGAWYCVRSDSFLMADALLRDAADLVRSFPTIEDYLKMRAKTLVKLVFMYLYAGEDWDRAKETCSRLLALSSESDGTEKGEERLWEDLARWQLSALKTLVTARVEALDMSGALQFFEKFYSLSERFIRPSQSERIRSLVTKDREEGLLLMISGDVDVGDLDAAKELYERRIREGLSATSLEEPTAMKHAMTAARQILRGYLASGDLNGAQNWYDELRWLQDRSGSTRDWRGDPMLHKIELLGIEAEAAGDLLAAYGRAGRMETATKLYRRIEDLIKESGFFGMYSMPTWIDAAMRMTFFCACKGDKASAKRYGEAYTKTSRIWKEVLDGTSGNLLPSWESEEQRQIRIARGLAEHYDARSRKELQGLYNGIAALSALSPHLKKDARLAQLQSETAERLRQPKSKQKVR